MGEDFGEGGVFVKEEGGEAVFFDELEAFGGAGVDFFVIFKEVGF